MKERPGEPAPRDIGERTLDYGVRAVGLFRALARKGSGAGRVIAGQYLRAATSIGANVAEAQSGETRADFVHKYGIALKEARESRYWLKLVAKSDLLAESRLLDLLDETEQIIAIIAAIIVRAKENKS